ncbi:Polyadenylate-binding protein RBP45 [Camellia lanceoleosa]|nr:Polyadenylate-binding protein RBP45 [Camellia lanceoleosa]
MTTCQSGEQLADIVHPSILEIADPGVTDLIGLAGGCAIAPLRRWFFLVISVGGDLGADIGKVVVVVVVSIRSGSVGEGRLEAPFVEEPRSFLAAQSQSPASSDEVRTLWIGDLQYWMDEQYLVNCFAQIGKVVTAKVIRNKQTAQSEGYGFIESGNRAAAERTLQTYNGTLMPNVEQNYN